MTTTQAQQLDRCNRSLQRARESLALDDPRRVSALMAARDEIDNTLRVLRWRSRPRPHPASLVMLGICSVLTLTVAVRALVLLTEGRPAVEVRK